RGFDRVIDLVGDQETELQANAVSGQDFLAGYEQQSLAHVVYAKHVSASPARVPTDGQNLRKFPSVIEQADMAFFHQKGMTDSGQDGRYNYSAEERCQNDNYKIVVHIDFLSEWVG